MTTFPTFRTFRRTAGLTAALAALTTTAAGCAGDQRVGSADCTSQIRLDGETYSGYGSSNHSATEHAVADEAECHDVGADAAGSVFPDDARSVSVSTFDGYAPGDVLGVRFDENTFTVFMADSLSPDERDRVLEELAGPDRQRRTP